LKKQNLALEYLCAQGLPDYPRYSHAISTQNINFTSPLIEGLSACGPCKSNYSNQTIQIKLLKSNYSVQVSGKIQMVFELLKTRAAVSLKVKS